MQLQDCACHWSVGIAILPFLKVGGMRLFQTESSDWSDKVMPRAEGIAKALLLVYVGFTLLAMVSYWLGGMALLDAVVHAMTTVATGGFANSDASFSAYADRPHLLWMASLFMVCGALPFVLYIRTLRGARGALWQDQQVRGLLGFLALVILALTAYRVTTGTAPVEALTHVTFNVVSVVTTTGYASDDYGLWGPLPLMAFLLLTFVGGCSGSTSGGMKIFRFQVAGVILRHQLRALVYSRGVFVSRYNGQLLTDARFFKHVQRVGVVIAELLAQPGDQNAQVVSVVPMGLPQRSVSNRHRNGLTGARKTSRIAGQIKQVVWHRLPPADPGDPGHGTVQAFQVLDVQH